MNVAIYVFLLVAQTFLAGGIAFWKTVALTTQLTSSSASIDDHCHAAKAGATKASRFSGDSVFKRSISAIRELANDGKERAVAFGRDDNGNVISSQISTGSGNSSTILTVPNNFADLHNHPRNYPPSSGDIYGLIDKAALDSSYMRYVVLPDGTVYALIVVDVQKARLFNKVYTRVPNPGYQPKFPDVIVDAIIDMQGKYNLTEEMAMAYMLKHFETGVALLKQEASGNFIVLNVEQIKSNGGKVIYVERNCQ